MTPSPFWGSGGLWGPIVGKSAFFSQSQITSDTCVEKGDGDAHVHLHSSFSAALLVNSTEVPSMENNTGR